VKRNKLACVTAGKEFTWGANVPASTVVVPGRFDIAAMGARENPRKTMGKAGKTMRKAGKTMGKLWENCGFSFFFPGFWGDLVELNGIDLGCNLMGI